jgi:hypothetical protein
MKRRVEVLLMALTLALVVTYCAIPKTSDRVVNGRIGAEQVVVVADGSDPMPICRGRACK